LARAIQSICMAQQDMSAIHLDVARASLEEYQQAGYHLGLTAQFALFGAVLLLHNDTKAALAIIEQGLSVVSQNSERLFEAELYRLKARALHMTGISDSAVEALLESALGVARRQQARSLELRAATDLAKLWMSQSRRADALDVLGSICGRFTEGFETRDLKEARAVLDQLQLS